jgi:nucleoside-triphosphatase THEP1
MVSLEFFPKKVLGTIMLNPHPFADAIKRHPEVETLLVTRDNRAEVMRKVLNWLMEGVN